LRKEVRAVPKTPHSIQGNNQSTTITDSLAIPTGRFLNHGIPLVYNFGAFTLRKASKITIEVKKMERFIVIA
jgi:hypothetical protein